MAALKQAVLAYLPDAQGGNPQSRLQLLRLGLDHNQDSVPEILSAAAAYRLKGWSVVPQLPGEKKPCIRWKPYQTRLPTVAEMQAWWDRWPDAGIAVVLGPISNLLAVDVDGEDAHRALVQRLGRVPQTARSISGSGKPHRYHLFFSHPGATTNAKYCPWHPNLEFRGHGGIVVLPPSRHKSGGHYRWGDGASVFEIAPARVPAGIFRELRHRNQRQVRRKRVVRLSRPANTWKQTSVAEGDRLVVRSLRNGLRAGHDPVSARQIRKWTELEQPNVQGCLRLGRQLRPR